MSARTTLVRRRFEDFEVGHELRTRARTVTEGDIAQFAGLSWDTYPLHTDEEYARDTVFGRRVAHGPLVYSMAIGMMPIDFFGDAIIAFLGVDALRHRAPVYPGDTVQVTATVKEVRPSRQPGRGVVSIEYVMENQDGEVVMDMTVQFLMRSEDR